MKFKAIKALGKEEQEKKLEEAKLELIKLRAQVSTGTPPKNTTQLKQLKKIIAKIKTIQNQK